MCSTRPCWEAIPGPICVLTLLLCRLQACRHYIDGRDSRVCVWAGLDERGDGILVAEGVRWQQDGVYRRLPSSCFIFVSMSMSFSSPAPGSPSPYLHASVSLHTRTQHELLRRKLRMVGAEGLDVAGWRL